VDADVADCDVPSVGPTQQKTYVMATQSLLRQRLANTQGLKRNV